MHFLIFFFKLNSNYYNNSNVANRSYANSSPLSNVSGRPSNSAPQNSNIQYGQSIQQRPLSSTANHHVQQHHFGTPQTKGPIIMRTLDKPSGVGTQVRLIKTTVRLSKALKFF